MRKMASGYFKPVKRREYNAVAKPGYPERVAMSVQIGDHLSKQFDVAG